MADLKTYNLKQETQEPTTVGLVDRYITNFKGGNRIQRGGGWYLRGGGSTTSSFLSTVSTVSSSIVPATNNTYSLGSAALKWADVRTVLINGVTPKAGSATYYVAASSGGAVTTAITFNTGILT